MISRRSWRILLAILVGFLMLAVVLFQISKSRSFQFFGEIHNRIDTSDKVVALTFDDGPVPGATQKIIGILASENIKATFFITGREIEAHPQEARLLLNAGHSLGNHSWSHPRMILTPYSTVADEIEKTNQRIRELGYDKEIYFRPPYGKKLFSLPFYLYKHDITTVTWDIEPETYQEIAVSSQSICDYVADNAKPGSIILLHVMYPSRQASMDAVPCIIKGLKEKGFSFVTLEEFLP